MSLLFSKNLTDFYNKIPGKTDDFKDVINKISGSGDLLELKNEDAVIYNVTSVLSIARGTYPGDPNFGCDLKKYLFDLADETNKKNIEDEVDKAIYPYVSTYRITKEIKYFTNLKGFSIKLTLTSPIKTISAVVTVDENNTSTSIDYRS